MTVILSNLFIESRLATNFEIVFENVHTYGKFVGRRLELIKLRDLLGNEEVQYITIRGFGGVGKTALAMQAVKHFSSGRVLVLSLVGTPSLDSVILRIATFLNIDTSSSSSSVLRTEVMKKLAGKERIL